MCHQSVGLVQGAIEAAGIPTISISVRPEITVNMRVSRAIYVRFPTGNPVGQPHMAAQQRTILRGALEELVSIETPGTLLEMPYRWRRMPNVDQGVPAALTRTARHTPPTPDLYSAMREAVDRIEGSYTTLMESLDCYRQQLDSEITAERDKDIPDAVKLQALLPQVRYLDELQEALEGPAHDALVRVADRVVRIKHWQDGVFI